MRALPGCTSHGSSSFHAVASSTELLERLVGQAHELPAPATGSSRHRGRRPVRIADLEVDRIEHPRLVEDDVDDQPVVEEPAVVDADVEQLAHRRVGAVAADDVRGRGPRRRSCSRRMTRSSCCSSASTATPRRISSVGNARSPRSSAASSSGWQNIDENGQPDAAVPMRPKRSSVVPAALRHSYTSAGSDTARSSSPMPHDWSRRPTSWSKCTAAARRTASGHCSSDDDRPSALREQHRQHEPRRPGADDRDVAVDLVDVADRPLLMAAQRLVAPGADAVVAAVVVPVVADDARAVAELDLEAGRGLQVEAEHPVVVVTAEPVRDRQLGVPTPGRTRPRRRRAEFASNITWCRRCGSSNGARASATVWWRALQWKKRTSRSIPGASSVSSQSDCASPRPVGEEADRLVEGRRGEHDVPEPDALGEEAARHQRRRVRRRRARRARARARRRRPTARRCGPGGRRAAREVVVGALDDVGADPAEPVDGGVEGGAVDGLEADGDRIVGRAGLHHEPLGTTSSRQVRAPPTGSPGNEADDVGQHRA